jgi:hypothetical protein
MQVLPQYLTSQVSRPGFGSAKTVVWSQVYDAFMPKPPECAPRVAAVGILPHPTPPHTNMRVTHACSQTLKAAKQAAEAGIERLAATAASDLGLELHKQVCGCGCAGMCVCGGRGLELYGIQRALRN